jgi:hypothetical protein
LTASDELKKLSRQKFFDRVGLWGFRGFSDASFLAKIRAKKNALHI